MILRTPTLVSCLFLALYLLVAPVTMAHWNGSRPDGHAPIGVMGDHIHAAGEWMLSYRYMLIQANGSLNGTETIDAHEILDSGYTMAPDAMTMHMHMAGAMWAPTNRLTLMGMVEYRRVFMSTLHLPHTTVELGDANTEGADNHAHGAPFHGDEELHEHSHSSQGLGDARLTALYLLRQGHSYRVLLNAGVSLPTGSIDESEGVNRMSYSMQSGSGTIDLLPGITYIGQKRRISWGAQASGTLRLGENANGYRLGHELRSTGWSAVPLTRWMSASARVAAKIRGNMQGSDPQMKLGASPGTDPANHGGTRVDVALGVNLFVPSGSWKNERLAVEASHPVYQSVNGTQMAAGWTWTLGWQASF